MELTKEQELQLLESAKPFIEKYNPDVVVTDKKLAAEKEFSGLFNLPLKVRMLSGEDFTVPKLKNKEYWKLLAAGKKLILEIAPKSWNEILWKMLDLSNPDERASEVFQILFDKDAAFISDNFDFNELMGVLRDFLGAMASWGIPEVSQELMKLVQTARSLR